MKGLYLINGNDDFDEWYDSYSHIYQLDRRITYLEDIIGELDLEKKRECPFCGERSVEFAPFGSLLYTKEQCPHCGSLARHRSLYLIMEREMHLFGDTASRKILHFAPGPSFYMLFEAMENVDYVTADLDRNGFKRELFFFTSGITSKYFKESQNYIIEEIDVRNMPYADATFDYIIINHVLEHVSEDKKAMAELRRVLKPGGAAFVSVPVEGETTNEDEKGGQLYEKVGAFTRYCGTVRFIFRRGYGGEPCAGILPRAAFCRGGRKGAAGGHGVAVPQF